MKLSFASPMPKGRLPSEPDVDLDGIKRLPLIAGRSGSHGRQCDVRRCFRDYRLQTSVHLDEPGRLRPAIGAPVDF
jgi:hypothetical protein